MSRWWPNQTFYSKQILLALVLQGFALLGLHFVSSMLQCSIWSHATFFRGTSWSYMLGSSFDVRRLCEKKKTPAPQLHGQCKPSNAFGFSQIRSIVVVKKMGSEKVGFHKCDIKWARYTINKFSRIQRCALKNTQCVLKNTQFRGVRYKKYQCNAYTYCMSWNSTDVCAHEIESTISNHVIRWTTVSNLPTNQRECVNYAYFAK